jgi:hypothetical protein
MCIVECSVSAPGARVTTCYSYFRKVKSDSSVSVIKERKNHFAANQEKDWYEDIFLFVCLYFTKLYISNVTGLFVRYSSW